jgi:hypothetical protein
MIAAGRGDRPAFPGQCDQKALDDGGDPIIAHGGTSTGAISTPDLNFTQPHDHPPRSAVHDPQPAHDSCVIRSNGA